jgi:hypothetical protein
MLRKAIRKLKKNDGVYHPLNNNIYVLEYADSLGWSVAKKVKPMWAAELAQDTVVKSIENPAYPGKKGDYLCIGFGNEHWVQSKESVLGKYIDTGKHKPIKVGYFKDPLIFHLYEPRPDRKVLACQVKKAVVVKAKWGKLVGKPGDFVVKPFDDILNANPSDVWVVDRGLFSATYKISRWTKFLNF